MLSNLSLVYQSMANQDDSFLNSSSVIRYKGFLFIEQQNQSWLIRPEQSPLRLLPFRTNVCSFEEAKQTLDKKLIETEDTLEAA